VSNNIVIINLGSKENNFHNLIFHNIIRYFVTNCSSGIPMNVFRSLGNAYFVFVSNFYATIEALMDSYQAPILDSFFDSMIREKDKFLHCVVINTTSTSKKSLVTRNKR
jgi:hypothetical protein